MADGDAMRFISEELGTGVGLDTDGGSGVATGWACGNDASVTAITKAIDAAQQRTGAGCQKVTFTTNDAGYFWLSQSYTLPGRSDLSGKGHVGATFTVSFYAKRGTDKGERARVEMKEYDANDVVGTEHASSYTNLTADYQLITASFTISDTDTSYVTIYLHAGVPTAQTDSIIYLDDASLKFDYTVETNPTGSMGLTYTPTLPETGEAGINNTYYRQRNTSTALKFRGVVMNFGMCSTAQKNALRAMTFYDKLFYWYPYNPDLPTYLAGYFKMLSQPVPIGNRWNRWQCRLEFNEN